MLCYLMFFFLPFLCLSLSPPFNSPPSFLIQHINEGQICTRGRRVYVCSRAWLSALFNSVDAGWLAGWGRGWQTAAAETSAGAPLSHPVIVSPMKGSLITPAQRGLPSSPIPETHSPTSSLPPHPPFPSLLHLLLIPHPPPIPSFHIHPALRRATFNQEGGWRRREGDEGGGGFKDSLSHKHTHTLGVHGCVFACVRSICQNSFSSVIGLGVPVSMR